MIGVYKITNLVNNKVYIGSSKNIENRWKAHKHDLVVNLHFNNHLQYAWNKYGEENFKFELIEECSEAVLRLREDYYIALYKAANHLYGYNIFSCTNIGIATSLSEETRHKISIACKGERNGNFGNHLSNEAKERISKAAQERANRRHYEEMQKYAIENHVCEYCGQVMLIKYASGRFCNKLCANSYLSYKFKGIKKTSEHNKKVSDALRGKVFSEEHKQKLSNSAKLRLSNSKNNPMFGKHHSNETKKLISNKLKNMDIHSLRFTGKHHSEESKRKILNSLKATLNLKHKEIDIYDS